MYQKQKCSLTLNFYKQYSQIACDHIDFIHTKMCTFVTAKGKFPGRKQQQVNNTVVNLLFPTSPNLGN